MNIWGWNNTNCWAGAVGAFIAGVMRLAEYGTASSEGAGFAELSWLPGEATVLIAAVLGGIAGLLGAMLVDLIKPTEH